MHKHFGCMSNDRGGHGDQPYVNSMCRDLWWSWWSAFMWGTCVGGGNSWNDMFKTNLKTIIYVENSL